MAGFGVVPHASKDEERRGIAINRWLLSVLTFCQHQKKPSTRQQNQCILRENIMKELYTEIDRKCSLYILTPQTGVQKGAPRGHKGVSFLL